MQIRTNVCNFWWCSPSTMSELLKKHRQNGTVKDMPRLGRPKVTYNNDDAFIVQQAHANPFTNATGINEQLSMAITIWSSQTKPFVDAYM